MEGLGVALTACMTVFEVQREEGQDGYPKLVSLRGEVQPNEGCAPRELNAFKSHTLALQRNYMPFGRKRLTPSPPAESLRVDRFVKLPRYPDVGLEPVSAWLSSFRILFPNDELRIWTCVPTPRDA